MSMTPSNSGFTRRQFLKLSAATGVATGALGTLANAACPNDEPGRGSGSARKFNAPYEDATLNRVAFPLGGMGAGMVCLEGTGAVSEVSVRNHPDVFNEPCSFAAIAIRGAKPIARVLEGPVPGWKVFGGHDAANGLGGSSFGLPRFEKAKFEARFPFATIDLRDEQLPLQVQITGWSPFVPGDADSSSLPYAALEYRFTNGASERIEAVFSYNARNFMAVEQESDGQPLPNAVRSAPAGFVLWGAGAPDKPWDEGWFCASVHDEPVVKVNHSWFRGGSFDPLTMAWKDIQSGAGFDRLPVPDDAPAPGATLYVPFALAPGESKTVKLRLCWYVPKTNLSFTVFTKPPAHPSPDECYRPWYAGRFVNIEKTAEYWATNFDDLRHRSQDFAQCFYDTTLPPEIVEAISANLAILKSPTILRQVDGRIWMWEGCGDREGCCPGACTHVWNYAQAIAHLFPNLERALRETEFGPDTLDSGFQLHRAALPIGKEHIPIDITGDNGKYDGYPAAADGQLGGIMKMHRDWRIHGDTEWLRRWWPKVKKSLDYCVTTWDPAGKGWVEEPHLNTYDIEFWGPNGMHATLYLGALRAAVLMGEALGDNVSQYRELYERGVKRTVAELYDGEYFIQKIEWKNLKANSERDRETTGVWGEKLLPDAVALREKEGPFYQYGTGCLADGVIGAWLAQVCGVGDILDPEKVNSHVRAVHRHNMRHDLSAQVNPQRPTYALGHDGGLLICTWPKGGALSLPFIYSNEVWTGIEYQVASHLLLVGAAEEGLDIVRTARKRYDGRIRNPFDEYECGHWYGRALSSYALLQGWSGARYDAVDKVLHLRPAVAGDFRCFISTATGYGSVGVRNGKPFLDVKSGRIEVREIRYVPRTAAYTLRQL